MAPYSIFLSGALYTHSLKKETRNLERKRRKTNLEVFRIAWKNSMSSYRQALKAARTEHILP